MSEPRPQVMTRADLYDWVRAHDCTIEPLAEHKAKVIWARNPKFEGAEAFINLPIDEQPVYGFTVCKVCLNLKIPIPTHLAHMKSVHDHIEHHQSKTGKKRK